MEFRILGPLEALGESGALALGGRTQRALLALLLLNAEKTLSVERLIDDVWSGAGSVKSAQVAIARLRAALGSAPTTPLVTRDHGYAIELGDRHTLDQHAFERGLERGRRRLGEGRLEEAADCLAGALALWRGRALAEFANELWAIGEARRLEELRALALELQIDAALALGHHVATIPELERLTRLYPDRERMHGQLMLALYNAGRQPDALRVFRDARRFFVEEYGIEPGAELRAVNQAILTQNPRLLHVGPRAAQTLGPQPAPLPARLRPFGPAEFVGRDREHEVLDSALSIAAGGERSAVLISGEPGVGKTRLVSDFALHAHASGSLVLGGRCDEGLELPYQPFAEAFAHLVEHASLESLQAHAEEHGLALARLVPVLARRLGQAPTPTKPASEAERYALFAAIDGLLAAAAPSTPTLLVLEDLHWADPPTILLLRYLLASPRGARLAIVATLRHTELAVNHPLSGLLAGAHREPYITRLELTGLELAEVRALALQLSDHGLGHPEGELADELHAVTGGNPFFITELLRYRHEVAVDAAPRPAIELPETVVSVVRHRLGRLDSGCQDVLQLVAITPGGAPFELLVSAGDGGAGATADAVEAGVRAGVLRERDEHGTTIVDFVHPLFRQALEGRASASRRAATHLLIADAMEKLDAPAGDRWLGELAYHTFAAGRAVAARVVGVCKRAGDLAMTSTAFDAAAVHYERAIEAMSWTGSPSLAERAAIALRCADAYHAIGDAVARRRQAEAAFADARTADQAAVLARAALVHGGARSTYGVASERTMEMLQHALKQRKGTLEDGLRAQVMARLAQEQYHIGHYPLADRLSSEAVCLARHAGDDGALAAAMEGRIWSLQRPETLGERLELADEMVERAAAADDRERLIWGLVWRSCAELEAGEVARVDEDMARLDALTETLRIPSQMFRVLTLQATSAIMSGDYGPGITLAQQTYEIGATIEPDNAMQTLAAQLLPMLREQNALASLVSQAETMASTYKAAPGWRCALAFVLLEADVPDRARAVFDELAQEGFDVIPRDLAWLLAHCYLAEVAAGLQDAKRAAEIHDRLLPYADRNGAVFDIASAGSVAHHLGLCARTAGCPDEAAKHFKAAIAFNDRTRQWPAAARSRYEYARLLADGATPQASEQPLAEALATARRLKLDRLVAQTERAAAETCREPAVAP